MRGPVRRITGRFGGAAKRRGAAEVGAYNSKPGAKQWGGWAR
jgi:hypothetical protein